MVTANQTAQSRIAWRLSGNPTLASTVELPITGTMTLYSPAAVNLSDVILTASGPCAGGGGCNCTFVSPGSCPPAALAAGQTATCAIACDWNTTDVTASAALNGYNVTTGAANVTSSTVDDSTACASLSVPLLLSYAWPSPWPAAVLRCSSFSTAVQSLTPAPAPLPECDMFNQTYDVNSAARLSVSGVVTAAANATAVIGCPQVVVATSLGFTRTRHWNW